ncbi:tripartite tricarboxylate transporter substrate binding protein [Ideonella sp. A 288]|uniref:Bug family tripartite tricarboxylate transporter substrate binding protein n=1 Tax=Ideonella sp. A 288 TaxID=1962181 RepID=UPI000B4B81BA|nr:tripartite tricarboxylate transporter substrate binding protein [Ideonella sp. A 288]
MNPCISRRHLIGGLLAAPVWAPTAFAQASWPTTTIRIVVPSPAGGGVDAFARVVGEQLAAALKVTVLIDNKAGASGLIGTKAAAQAAPDGYTIAYIHSGLVTVQAMNPRLDLLKELRPVAKLSYSPFMAVVNAESRFKTMQDLVAEVQAHQGKLTFGSGGPGSPAHLAVEYIEEKLGNFKCVHVPFKGAADSANAIVGGQVDFQVGLLAASVPLVQAGKLRALAVTSRNRLPQWPNVPTMSEAGVPGFVFEPWGGFAVPAGTPDAVIARLNEVLPGVLASAPVKDMVAKQGSVIDFAPPAAFAAQIVRELEVDKLVVKRLGMTQQ